MQEHLMHGYGYLHLEEAYNLYSSFNECSCPNKQAFRDILLDPHHGLTYPSLKLTILYSVFIPVTFSVQSRAAVHFFAVF